MMQWVAMVAVALSVWGAIFSGRIVVEDESENRAFEYVTSQAWADLWSQPPDCIISVLPSHMAYMTDTQRQNVITHEVGHCLGLEHINQPGVMYPDGSQYDFSGYDRAEFWHHYPAPYRVTIGMVSQ